MSKYVIPDVAELARTHDRTGYWCPYCGTQEMWQERGPGDYYVGPATLCAACGEVTDRLAPWTQK